MLARFGLWRWPVATAIVFIVTATVNLSQFASANVLTSLQRTPAGIHGDWWRSATSLLVQDGGVGGTASNLAFLVIVGVAAEQVAARWAWLVAYLGAAAVGEATGYAWQPNGGGNSVAICGLAALVMLAFWRRDDRLPAFGPGVAALWAGVLLATWKFPLVAVGIVAAGLTNRPSIRDDPRARRLVMLFVIAVGVLLCGVRNIHGAALLAGLGIAPAVYRRGARPAAPAGVAAPAQGRPVALDRPAGPAVT